MYIPATHRNQTNQLHRSCGFKVTHTHTHIPIVHFIEIDRFYALPEMKFENVLCEKFIANFQNSSSFLFPPLF